MLNDPKALGEKVEALRAEIVELDAIETPTEEQAARFDAALAEFDAAKAEFDAANERAAKVEAVRAAAVNPVNRERGFHVPEVAVKRDVFEDLDSVVRGIVPGDEMKARALTAIEQGRAAEDSHKERMTELVEDDPNGVLAQYILAAANPAYRSAFTKIMNAGGAGHAYLTPEEGYAVQAVQRAAMSTTAGNGGYAIPAFSDVSLIYTGTQSSNAVRRLATVKTGVAHDWKGLSSAGTAAYFKAEGVAVTDGSYTFSQPVITSHQAAVFVQANLEILDDASLLSDLPMVINKAKDDLESTKFLTGTGSGEPKGLVHYAVTASKIDTTVTGTNSVSTSGAVADFDTLALALPEAYQPGASVLAARSYFQVLRNTSAAQAGTSFWNDFGKGIPAQVRGYDAYVTYGFNGTFSTTADAVAVIGDIAQAFYIYDRLGLTLEPTGHLVSTTTGLPLGTKGFLARWRVGSNVINGSALKALIVK